MHPVSSKVALYVAGLIDEKGFKRKPSHDSTDRMYAAITAQPFSTTTIRANFEDWRNNNRWPNSLTPRDAVTPWLEAGRPMYDNTTLRVTTESGASYGPYITNKLSPLYNAAIHGTKDPTTAFLSSDLPIAGSQPVNFYVDGISFTDRGDPANVSFLINNGEAWSVMQKQPTGQGQTADTKLYRPEWLSAYMAPTAANRTAADWMLYDRLWSSSTGFKRYGTGTYAYSITDRSLYDWKNVNVSSINQAEFDAQTYNVEIEQRILNNLFLQVGWFRQELDSTESYTMGQQNAPTIYIDTNKYLPDGKTLNPYAGLPYVYDMQADTWHNPEMNETVRAQLAYDLDFSKNKSWTKWFGRHQILGYAAKTRSASRAIRLRAAYVGFDPRLLPFPTATNVDPNHWGYADNSPIRYRYYYLANPGDTAGTVTHSAGSWGNPGFGGPDSATVSLFNWSTRQWEDANVELGTEVYNDKNGNSGVYAKQKEVESYVASIQSYLLDDRIVTTLGWRRDKWKARNTTSGALSDGTPALKRWDFVKDGRVQDIDFLATRWADYERLSGNTFSKGIVVKPFKKYVSLHYNESTNFNPPSDAATDLSGNKLPKPEGFGKDYGFSVQLLKDKLVARVNWFTTKNENERTSLAGTVMTRVQTFDKTYFKDWADTVVRIRSGEDPTLTTFGNTALTSAQQDEVAKITGLPYNWTVTSAATQSNDAKGIEVQLTYNPVPNWTMKLTGGKQTTIYSNVAPEFTSWAENRMATWTTAVATDMPETVMLRGSRETSLRNFWSAYGYNKDITLDNNYGWTNSKNYYDGVVTAGYNDVKSQEGLVSPAQRRYSASFLTSYSITTGKLNGVSFGGSARWADKAAIGYYGIGYDEWKAAGLDTMTAAQWMTLTTAQQTDLKTKYMTLKDRTRPIYDDATTNIDLFLAYTRKIYNDKVRMRIQFNVRNAFEGCHLQPIGANVDGSLAAYRIIDGREYILSTTFDF